MDFTDKSDKDDTFLESGHSYVFELIAEARSAADEGDIQVHSCDGADVFQW